MRNRTRQCYTIFQALWVIGGVGSAMRKTEIVTEHGSTIGPDTPSMAGSSCATHINATHGILIGIGNAYSNKESLILNLETYHMEAGPELSIKRDHAACSKFGHVNGTEYIIVAGGWTSGTTTEILNISDNSGTWIAGKMLS